MSDNIYFAAKEPEIVAGDLLGRAKDFYDKLIINEYLEKIKTCWMYYYGAYYDDVSTGHRVSFSGEQGELVDLPVNHLRNFAEHMLNITTANRPSMDARATNTDYKSIVQTQLANGLLDYYMREKRLERFLKRGVEYAIVMGAGYIKMEWNATAGEVYDIDRDTGRASYEGDVKFSNPSPLDVVFDTTKESSEDHEWYLVRSFQNKFNLAAKYPDLADNILKVKTKDSSISGFNTMSTDKTDDVPVFEFFHKRCDALSEGRYILFLDEKTILIDSPMPYRSLPIYRVAPSDIMGTPFGYTILFDLLPIQEALNSLYSTVLTNQTAFGVQNILVPRGCDINVAQLGGGLNVLDYNAAAGQPAPLNLTFTPEEIFNFIRQLEQLMETISGINSVTRGNPESSLKSGTALALVQSMALQFMSGLQQSYVQLIEDTGTGLINMLKDFATVKRVAAIVGKSNRPYLKEFTGDQLSNVARVIVDVGNPLARCLAKDTPILMYDGSIKKVQDVKCGDLIMGPDSSPRTVQSIARGQEEMYEVSSKDKNRKISYTCNESHILTLKYCSDDYRYDAQKGDIIDISIKEYLSLTERQKRLLQGFTVGVEFDTKEVSIPPYILGSWLGDGNSNTCSITTMDYEVADEWKKYAEENNLQLRVEENTQPNKAKNYFITSGQMHGSPDRNPVLNKFQELELIKNKHIPKHYLLNNSKIRLELLAGLLDTDGTLLDETFMFTQKCDMLTQQVIFLAKSLGFRVTYRKKISKSNLCKEGEYNQVTIGGDTHRIPTRIKRKQAIKKDKARDWLNYGIQIKNVGYGDYYGFTLEEEPHFLLGDFTVTHNTIAGRMQLAEQLVQYQVIKNPEQILQVMNTGRIDTMTEDQDHEMNLVSAENDKMLDGEAVQALIIDEHAYHIKRHKSLINDPDLRKDPNLVQNVLAHIQQHIDFLKSADPDLLMLTGQQPLSQPPPQGAAPPPEEGPMMPPASGNVAIGPNPENPEQVMGPGMEQPVSVPTIPQPPAPFENLPVQASEVQR